MPLHGKQAGRFLHGWAQIQVIVFLESCDFGPSLASPEQTICW
jgi:hypothetical protein